MKETKADDAKPGKSRGGLIYVVDDEPMLLDLASMILEPLGYTIETFRSPESALQAFAIANPKPALIITDYAMHTLTGLDLAEKCRRIQPLQKVLLLSGTVGQDIFRNAPVQPDCFLAKPYQANQLIDLVKSIVAETPD